QGGQDCWLIKTDADGNIQWQKTYGGSLDDYPYFVHRFVDGTIAFTGSTFSKNGDVTDQHGLGDIWLVKTDSIGNMLWQQTFGGSDTDVGRACLSTTDGEMFVAGYTESDDDDVTDQHGSGDGWVIKTCSPPDDKIKIIGSTDICNTGQVTLQAT